MFVQWTTQKLRPVGRSPWRGHISHRAILVKSEWVNGKSKKINRYLATIKFKPARTAEGGEFIKTDDFLMKCRRKLWDLAVGDAEQCKILLEIENHLADFSGPPKCPRLHNADPLSDCSMAEQLFNNE